MAMITEAAVAYDKTSPASFSLDAFEGATMTPLVFKEQLRRCEVTPRPKRGVHKGPGNIFCC